MANKKTTKPAKAVYPKIPDYGEKIVVKFKDYVQLPYKEGVEKYIQEYKVGPWKKLAKKFSGIGIGPLFNRVSPEILDKMTKLALDSDPDYKDPNFKSYFTVTVPPDIDAKMIVKVLSKWKNVEDAHVSGKTKLPAVDPTSDPDVATQTYLDPSPDGIDAEYAWNFTGGDGDATGLKFVDIEKAWDLNHSELPTDNTSLIHGVIADVNTAPQIEKDHGTAVLGIICSVNNTVETVGIVPNVPTVQTGRFDDTLADLAAAINGVAATLAAGDVLLIEAVTDSLTPSEDELPVEQEPAVYTAIENAVTSGIVVVLPVGVQVTGVDVDGNDTYYYLDDYQQGPFHIFTRLIRDSGAIYVAASQWYDDGGTWIITRRSNYGTRVDSFAFGDDIVTLDTTTFGDFLQGTSAAAAIVAGACVSMQAMWFNKYGTRLTPTDIRDYITLYGTDSAPAQTIGKMPNLQPFCDNHIAAPDVFIRDNPGDDGEPHMGSISSSPDIMVTEGDYAGDADAAFAGGEVGNRVEMGQTNYVWARALNRGSETATGVVATIYWSDVATLITPPWTEIGTIPFPDIPTGSTLIAAGPIDWLSTDLPTEGHYCLIGVLHHVDDPAPPIAPFVDWDDFCQFIRDENNVTWKNFNVVDLIDPAPSPPPDPELPEPEPEPDEGQEEEYAENNVEFKAAGAQDRDLYMELEFQSNLPKGATLMLEVPFNWIRPMRLKSQYNRIRKKQRTILVPIKFNGKQRMKPMLFKAKVKIPMKLHVQVPKKYLNRTYEVSVKQLYEGREVGRVTWLFKSKKELDKLLDLRRRHAMGFKKKKK